METPELTPLQQRIRDAFWEAIRTRSNCGSLALARQLGASSASVKSAMRRLRDLGVIPKRPPGDGSMDEEWRRQALAALDDPPASDEAVDWHQVTDVPTTNQTDQAAKETGQVAEGNDQDKPPSEEISALRQQLKETQRELEAYRRDHGSLQAMMHELGDLVDAIPAPRIIYRQPSVQRVTSPVTLVLHFTDWHMGAVQDADEIEGFNAFSPAILDARITNLIGDVLDWVELHRTAYDVDECRILVTGDLISGDIHEELRVTNAYPTPVQLVEAGKLLAKATSLLSPHFSEVGVDLVTVDNHGRLTKKPQHKEGGYNTYNFPLATIAKLELRNHSNVDVRIWAKEQQVVNVKGREYLICHGHQVRGWAGFPYYGLQRKVGLEAAKRLRAQIGRFDRIVLGHYHAPLQHPWYWIGGSASGTDAYDHSEGRESMPIQSAWFVHPRHGEFDRTDWDLHE